MNRHKPPRLPTILSCSPLGLQFDILGQVAVTHPWRSEDEMRVQSLADWPEVLPVLAQLHHEEWSGVSPFKTPEQHATKLRARIGLGLIPATYVLILHGAVAGSVSLLNHDDIGGVGPDLSPWLSSLLVIPTQRGHGLGRALVEHCASQARQLGFSALHLWTDTHERFYEHLGWNAIERGKADGPDAVVMKLSL